jgi:hypothetical protein
MEIAVVGELQKGKGARCAAADSPLDVGESMKKERWESHCDKEGEGRVALDSASECDKQKHRGTRTGRVVLVTSRRRVRKEIGDNR